MSWSSGVEAGAGELVDTLPDVGEVGPVGLRFEPDVPHVHGGVVLAAHGLLGAVAGGVEGALSDADQDDLGAGVPHLRVVGGGAELDHLLDGVLLEQLHGGLVRPVAQLLPERDLAFGHVRGLGASYREHFGWPPSRIHGVHRRRDDTTSSRTSLRSGSTSYTIPLTASRDHPGLMSIAESIVA